jgi:hypothetical protein
MFEGGQMRTRIVVVAAALFGVSCGAEMPEGPPFRTDNSVPMLMANILDPAADLLWDAVGTVIDETGETHWEPVSEDERTGPKPSWMQVRLGTMALAESANLLMMEGRARDQDQWIRFSEQLADAAMQAFEAAEAEDADRVFELGEAVYNTCNNCHQLYWVGDADRGRSVE